MATAAERQRRYRERRRKSEQVLAIVVSPATAEALEVLGELSGSGSMSPEKLAAVASELLDQAAKDGLRRCRKKERYA